MELRLSASAIADRYEEVEVQSIASAFKILAALEFFPFVVEQNNRLLVEAFDDESEAELAKKILENRQTNRLLLSIHDLTQTLEGMQNA